ncbi:SRPBCC domain-containing protein [Agrococcus sp. ARC_14]|uniref:SRPBCC domain-containing protein n=1 Tax=Agrococcus sp. ARC_14 TaxID=2919927 RepID=UPI001F064937|nr:SRPBCC domain-containing protein [Agrococcus sp. ARC_14]MCH1883794.1 SRPBCC domain-containing protein [Agrococcus sp. ARC_14]
MKTRFSLPDDTSIAYERDFSAPATEVWKAYTEPEIVRTWMLGPNPDTEFPTCEMDMRTGGSFRWVWVDEGGELIIAGDVLEADEPHRIVTTETMSGSAMQGMEFPPTTNTTTLTEADGITTLRTVTVYDSKESRDGAYASGMDAGIEAGYERLAARFA